jgi:hypothetical protein
LCGTGRRPVDGPRAIGVVPRSESMHQNHDGVPRGDEIEQDVHIVGGQGQPLRIAAEHKGQRVRPHEIVS